jgi:hypothetical protein
MNSYNILVGKSEGKRPLVRPKCIWVYNSKVYLRKAGCGGMGWNHLAQDREQWRALVNTGMNCRVS